MHCVIKENAMPKVNIKKNDYNTVQFFPKARSSIGSAVNQNIDKPPTVFEEKMASLIRLLILLALLIAILCGIAATIYFMFFTPQHRFDNALKSGDYEACAVICEENINDAGFKNHVLDQTAYSISEAEKHYLDGTASAEHTIAYLDSIDALSAGITSERTSQLVNKINEIEVIKQIPSEAESQFASGNYAGGIATLKRAAEEAAAYEAADVNVNTEIANVLTEYLNELKYYYFSQFANTVWQAKFDDVIGTCNYFLSYIDDEDFSDYAELVKKLSESKATYRSTASTATSIANEAKKAMTASSTAAR